MKRILLFNGGSPTSLLLKQQLEDAGHVVTEINEEERGLQFYREHPVDVIIADILTPELSGLRSIIRFKSAYPEVKIIAIENIRLSNRFEAYDPLKSARIFGAERTFSSPIELSELLLTIEKLESNKPIYLRRRHRHKQFQFRYH